MVKKVLIGSILFSFVLISTAASMKFETMRDNTSIVEDEDRFNTAEVNEMVDGDFRDESILTILPKLEEQAFAGNYYAQYYLAQYFGTIAKDKVNGEKFALEKNKALLLLISCVYGGFWKSLDELKFALNGTTENKLKDLRSKPYSEMDKLASEIALSGKI